MARGRAPWRREHGGGARPVADRERVDPRLHESRAGRLPSAGRLAFAGGRRHQGRDAPAPAPLRPSTLAADFGPLALRAYREEVIRAGLARPAVNAYVPRIGRLFKWAVANELVSPSVHHALSAVDGLRRGRSIAPEPDPIRPVAEEVVERTLPFLAPPVAAMVRLQLLTGMRPNEVTAMRMRDLDRSGAVCSYAPERHNTAHQGLARTIARVVVPTRRSARNGAALGSGNAAVDVIASDSP